MEEFVGSLVGKRLQIGEGLRIVKDVVVVFREAFHPSMDDIIQGRKPWQK